MCIRPPAATIFPSNARNRSRSARAEPRYLRYATLYRTHTCGELRPANAGQTVTLCGWVDSYRDHKGVLFIDLRDRYGKTQITIDSDSGAETLQLGGTVRTEFVI